METLSWGQVWLMSLNTVYSFVWAQLHKLKNCAIYYIAQLKYCKQWEIKMFLCKFKNVKQAEKKEFVSKPWFIYLEDFELERTNMLIQIHSVPFFTTGEREAKRG